jgi:predicted TIM-barrel fold metal-dependent hydrolase
MQLAFSLSFCLVLIPFVMVSQTIAPEPIIDMHLHAVPADNNGPPPAFICAPYDYFPSWDPKSGGDAYERLVDKTPPCASPLRSPATDEELMRKTLEIVKSRNVTGLASGPLEIVEKWKKVAGPAILPAIGFDPQASKPSPDELRALVASERVVAFAEVTTQYMGIAVNDIRMEPYYELAEKLDVPIGVHMGPGPPGVIYFGASGYRMRLSSLLLLEDVLARHPKLRLWAMHAGWPLGDDAIAALYAHPQLYVDVGIISYAFPREEFYRYLKRLIDAGFENRIMFGSDQMVWPDALAAAIDCIQAAPILTDTQKRDILYNNAARFLRLTH